MTTEEKAVLLSTGSAAGVLGVSSKTLRRYRDIEDGFLIQDKDCFMVLLITALLDGTSTGAKKLYLKEEKDFLNIKTFN